MRRPGYHFGISTLAEIKSAIEKLSLEERAELARWLHGWMDDEWDEQIKSDARRGRLDALMSEVDRDIARGGLRELP